MSEPSIIEEIYKAFGFVEFYWLSDDKTVEHEVTKAEYVAAERKAGFYNTMGQPDEPATAGFSTTDHDNLRGRTEMVSEVQPDQKVYRSSGDMVCACGQRYDKHDTERWIWAMAGEEVATLRRLCNGDLVKL